MSNGLRLCYPFRMKSARVAWFGVGLLGLLGGCQHLNFSRGEQPPEKPPSCLGDLGGLEKKNFDVDGALEDRLKATFGGVLELESTAKKLDERLASTCDNLARELGAKPVTNSAPESGAVASNEDSRKTEGESANPLAAGSCKKAITQLQAYKKDHEISLALSLTPAKCAARTDEFAACARRCDATLPPGDLQIGCEEGEQRGRCGGKCTGQCAEMHTTECAATCAGECNGSCNKGFYGKCGGKCVGTCDMGNVNGKCDGVCDGKCLSDAKGTCEGKCSGKCVGACLADMKNRSCDGTCRGQCDTRMVAAVCSHIYPPAEMSQDCVAKCSAATTSKLQCSVDNLTVTVVSAKKESKGLELRNVLSGRLKEVAEIGEGMKLPLDNASSRVSDALDALSTDLETNSNASRAVGSCLSEANERKRAATASFAALGELSEALFAAARE